MRTTESRQLGRVKSRALVMLETIGTLYAHIRELRLFLPGAMGNKAEPIAHFAGWIFNTEAHHCERSKKKIIGVLTLRYGVVRGKVLGSNYLCRRGASRIYMTR
jgi:hypothetical protein